MKKIKRLTFILLFFSQTLMAAQRSEFVVLGKDQSPEGLEEEEIQRILLAIKEKPLLVLENLRFKNEFPSMEVFSEIYPKLLTEENPEEVYQNQKKYFNEEKSKVEPEELINTSLISALGECCTSYCPYERSNSKLRTEAEESSKEIFSSYFKETQKSNHVVTIFAGGALFQDFRILMILADQMKEYEKINDSLEINLIDVSYGRYIKEGKLLNARDGLAIQQFNHLAHVLLPNLKITYVYSEAIDYAEHLLLTQRGKTDILWAIDFAEGDGLSGCKCSIDFSLLQKTCTNESFLKIMFPYNTEERSVEKNENPSISPDEFKDTIEKIKKFYKELEQLESKQLGLDESE